MSEHGWITLSGEAAWEYPRQAASTQGGVKRNVWCNALSRSEYIDARFPDTVLHGPAERGAQIVIQAARTHDPQLAHALKNQFGSALPAKASLRPRCRILC